MSWLDKPNTQIRDESGALFPPQPTTQVTGPGAPAVSTDPANKQTILTFPDATVVTKRVDAGSAPITKGYVAMQKNGKLTLATTAALALGLYHAGLVLAAASAGGTTSIITQGLIDPTTFNLGAGAACAVGTDANGKPVRVTDGTCVSKLKFLGVCDANGAVYVSPRTERVYDPHDFGAVGDGVANDTIALQTCINAAVNAGGIIQSRQATYCIDTELSVPANKSFHWRGSIGFLNATTGVTVKATASMRSCFTPNSYPFEIDGIKFDANSFATYGVYIQSGSFARFVNCGAINALVDGFNSNFGDGTIFENCYTQACGLIYCSSSTVAAQYSFIGSNTGRTITSTKTGTMTVAANRWQITLSGGGAPDLTTLGIRFGDLLRLGGGSGGTTDATLQIFSITEVLNSTTLVVSGVTTTRKPIAGAYTEWAIHVGDGIHLASNTQANNSGCEVRNGVHQFNASCGVAIPGGIGGNVPFSNAVRGSECQNNGAGGVLVGVAATSGGFDGGTITFVVTTGSASVTASTTLPIALVAGTFVEFSSQPGEKYLIATVVGTAVTLNRVYTGTSNGAAVLSFDTLGSESSGMTLANIYSEANVAFNLMLNYVNGGQVDNMTNGSSLPSNVPILYDQVFVKVMPTGFGPGGVLGNGSSNPILQHEEIALGNYVSSVPHCGQQNYRTGYVQAVQGLSAGTQIDPSTYSFIWMTASSAIVLTHTPTVAAPPNGHNQQVRLYNASNGAFPITLQDNTLLAGSNVFLKTPTCTIQPLGFLDLVYDEIYHLWVEVNRSGCSDQGATTAATGNSDYVVDSGLNTLVHLDETIFVSGNAKNVELPDPALWKGRRIKVKAVAGSATTYTVISAGSGPPNVDGAASYAMTAKYQYNEFTSDGAAWWVTA